MAKRSLELVWALVAVLLISAMYAAVTSGLRLNPAAGGLFGHSLGILGFLLMLTTETAYSLRKRSRFARWGRMASWLQFHIFTGIVGPFLVLLHTAWKFNGLAGIVLLLTVIIVISGFIGRYIYTAVPRTADGAEVQARALSERMQHIEAEIAAWADQNQPAAQIFLERMSELPSLPGGSLAVVFERFFSDLVYRIAWRLEQRRFNAQLRAQAAVLERLARERRALHRQIASLATARRLLSVWHSIHIPIGVALFTAAFVHITAAVYYATLLR